MGQQFCSINHARAGTSEIRIRVNGIYALVAHRGKISPARLAFKMPYLFEGLFKIEAARREDDDLGRPVQHVGPRDAHRICLFAGQLIGSTRKLNHLPNPVPSAVDRVSPLHAEDTGPPGNLA